MLCMHMLLEFVIVNVLFPAWISSCVFSMDVVHPAALDEHEGEQQQSYHMIG